MGTLPSRPGIAFGGIAFGGVAFGGIARTARHPGSGLLAPTPLPQKLEFEFEL